MGPLKWDFADIYLRTSPESVLLEIQNVWGSSFLSKCSKFKLEFKNKEKASQKVFFFFYNCIWIGIINFYLLRTEYLSLAAKLLANSRKIWLVNKGYFFHLIILGSDQ